MYNPLSQCPECSGLGWIDDVESNEWCAACEGTGFDKALERHPQDTDPQGCDTCEASGYVLQAMGYPEEHPVKCPDCGGSGER